MSIPRLCNNLLITDFYLLMISISYKSHDKIFLWILGNMQRGNKTAPTLHDMRVLVSATPSQKINTILSAITIWTLQQLRSCLVTVIHFVCFNNIDWMAFISMYITYIIALPFKGVHRKNSVHKWRANKVLCRIGSNWK